MSLHIDKVTKERIKLAHPKLRDELETLIEKINKDILTGNAKVRITYTLRTFAEQDELYAQGRTKPGKKVTNAKGGDSFHNYGLAVDIVLIINGAIASWDTKKDFDKDQQADWMEVVKAFKDAGWAWGGDWRTFKDMPHFEKTFGNTISALKRKHQNKQFITGTKYVRI
jgi:peptidoglycan L-alanyl-D-glutamate endopeptidase CwlK